MQSIFLVLCVECMGVALVNKTIQVSGARFHRTSVYATVYFPPQVTPPSITIYPPNTLLFLPPTPFPFGNNHSVVCICESFFKGTPLFIAVLFTIAYIWKQPKYPSVVEWIKKLLLGHIKEENLTLCDSIDGPGENYAK